MKREEYNRTVNAIARAAEFLPNLEFSQARKFHRVMVKQMKKANRTVRNTFDADDMERFETLGRLLEVAARFKETADKLVALGPISPRLGVGVRAEDLGEGDGPLPPGFEEEISPPKD
jgi:hypothetical protein